MYAGIGTSCSHHLDGLAQDSGERFLQALLHAVAVWLNLPTVVARAVVGKGDEETNQSNLRFDDLRFIYDLINVQFNNVQCTIYVQFSNLAIYFPPLPRERVGERL